MTKNKTRLTFLVLGILLVLILLGPLLFRRMDTAAPSPVAVTADSHPVTASPTNVWDAFQQSMPYAYFTPLPETVESPLDGIYTKVNQSWPQWWRCMRCADYRAAGGIWKLQFDKGVMRIYYEVNDWRSIASYTVSGDQLFIFNDPYCPENTGKYKWSIENGGLNLETVDDPCAFDLRAENLTQQSWQACTDQGEGVSPPGCELGQIPDPVSVSPQEPLRVTVYGGDSRFFDSPPEVYAHANSADMAPPEGISVTFDGESIPYGLQRVLWWNGGWIEASFDETYSSAGVQILGEPMIGWARILFDDQEVWRGKTADIWSKSGRHGGYIEISGFKPGDHTLRVEAMGFDYRPVTVASFGFSREGNVRP
jgi:hypothetical protein